VVRASRLRVQCPAMAKSSRKTRPKPPPQALPPRRSFIERPSTAVLFMFSVFAGGLVIGAIIAKLRPPTPATTQPINYTVTQPTTTAATRASPLP
jgi:hypothetical protein